MCLFWNSVCPFWTYISKEGLCTNMSAQLNNGNIPMAIYIKGLEQGIDNSKLPF